MAIWKSVDAVLQLLTIAMILPASGAGAPQLFTVLCLLFGLQCLSIVFWLFVFRKEPYKLRVDFIIRFAFILVALTALAFYGNNDRYFMAYLILFTYPVLGPVYLLLTLAELICYRKLQKKEPA